MGKKRCGTSADVDSTISGTGRTVCRESKASGLKVWQPCSKVLEQRFLRGGVLRPRSDDFVGVERLNCL